MNKSFPIRVWNSSSIPSEWIQSRRSMCWGMTAELETYVKQIVWEVRNKGDAAIVKFTKKFDNVDLNAEELRVTRAEIEDSYDSVNEKQISALEFIKRKVETFERHLLKRINFEREEEGVSVCSLSRPLQSVGCYVPGGNASYPSTLIMTCVPAKVAGVSRVVVCSPTMSSGKINPLTAVAADICGVDETYKIGGAHAIAALAYGTGSVSPVRKIVGPGNKYVTMAKILVSRHVAIDMPAGPSEVLILSDETADPSVVALDMISQAEHGIDGVSGLITTSKELAQRVIKELERVVPSLPRGETVMESLVKNGFVIIFDAMDEMTEFANIFAPEHLEIITKNPMNVADGIKSAGLILLGQYTPVSASDYCTGTNHVLPTSGFGHVFSGLSVLDFVRRVNLVECSKNGLLKLKKNIKIISDVENLPNHFLAVEGRFDEKK